MFFSLDFFYEFIYFLTILYFGVKLLILDLCDFFILFIYFGLSRVQVDQVNPS